MSKKKYITTPIYYVNDVPHIGHAYTTIAADVLARYYRAHGDEVFLLTGTDEHGAKIVEAAAKDGCEPKDFVDSLVPKFQHAWSKLNISYDQFIRTTDPGHEKVVQEFVKRLVDAGYVTKKSYTGLYCVGCERFLQLDELVEGKCPDHNRVPEEKSEENYFFLLSKFADKLLTAIEKGEIEIAPEGRKNEVVGKIKQGLEDVSISRVEVRWGIPYPGDDKQTIYVWVDALINYWSATIIYKDQKSNIKDQKGGRAPYPEWPASLHLMAKEILWFHAVIWPAMLLAIGEALPKKVFAHGFFTINGKKMSKSLGNVLDPITLADKYGADALRYALLREFPFGEDGDISEQKIAGRYNTELASGLGNLVSRVCAMTEKYFDGVVPEIKSDPEEHPLRIGSEYFTWKQSYSNLEKFIDELKFDEALQSINKFIASANKYIDDTQPWELAKQDKKDELAWVLYGLLDGIHQLAWMILPFMPETSIKIAKALGIEGLQSQNPEFKNSFINIRTGKAVSKPESLFPRLEI